jgi:zinc transport system substrate-binding protein
MLHRIQKKDVAIFLTVFALIGIFFIIKKIPSLDNSQYSVIEDSTLPKVQVATSFPLIADWINLIGQSRVDVKVFASPSDPVLDDWVKQADGNKEGFPVRLFFAIGNGFDDWTKGLSDKSPKIKVILLNQFASNSTTTLVDILNPKNNLSVNGSYYWLSLENAREAVQGIARNLGMLDVGNKEYYINNAYEYSIQLDTLLRETLNSLKYYKSEKVVLNGTKWEPFAESLQLHVAGTFDISSGQSDVSKTSATIRGSLRKYGVKAIVADSNFKESDIGKSLQGFFGVSGIDPWSINSENYLDYMRSTISELLRTF